MSASVALSRKSNDASMNAITVLRGKAVALGQQDAVLRHVERQRTVAVAGHPRAKTPNLFFEDRHVVVLALFDHHAVDSVDPPAGYLHPNRSSSPGSIRNCAR